MNLAMLALERQSGQSIRNNDGTSAISFNPGVWSGIGFNRNAANGNIYHPGISAWQLIQE